MERFREFLANIPITTSCASRKSLNILKCYLKYLSANPGILILSLAIPLGLLMIQNFRLPYFDPSTGNYGQGWRDIYCVAAFGSALTAMWAMSVTWIFEPIATRMGLSRGKARRFAEQTWLCIYYSSMWTLGMVSWPYVTRSIYLTICQYLWSSSRYWTSLRELWATFPTKQLGGGLKFYLLTSLAFWFHQIIVVNVEKKRNDYSLYMAHHIATAVLMWSAYVYSAHELAHLVSNLMEAADVFLCVSNKLYTNEDSRPDSITDRKDLPVRGLENEWEYRAGNIRHSLAYIPTHRLRPIMLDPVPGHPDNKTIWVLFGNKWTAEQR